MAEFVRHAYTIRQHEPPEGMFDGIDAGLDLLSVVDLDPQGYRDFVDACELGFSEFLQNFESSSPSGKESLERDWNELIGLLRKDDRYIKLVTPN